MQAPPPIQKFKNHGGNMNVLKKIGTVALVAIFFLCAHVLLGSAAYSVEKKAFNTDSGGYPSISGEVELNFTPYRPMNISKIYIYPCLGTGGHAEYIGIFYQNGTEIANSSWDGYVGDWRNLTLPEKAKLVAGQTYKVEMKLGSYPQIIHQENITNSDGTIICTKFTDANGKTHKWIPAFKLFEEVIIPDTTPPGPVTGLNESQVGKNYIIWNWTNPGDPDLQKTTVYLNDQFLINLPKTCEGYNVTGLNPDTEYKLGIKTVDTSGNPSNLTEDLAKTLKIPNQKPAALFNYTPQSPLVNQSISFDASDSFDPDGEIEQYLWDFNNDTITDATGKTANHPYSSAGIKEAILRVIDNEGAENQTSRQINVSEIPNQPPVALFSYSPESPKVNRTVVFNASGSFDPDGEIAEYYWLFGDGKNATGEITEHNYSADGVKNVTLRVTDDKGALNQTSKLLQILQNVAPEAVIGGPYSGKVNESVLFEGYGLDPDGNITKYTLEFGDGTNITRTISPPQKQVNITETHNYPAAQIYNAILKVLDDDNALTPTQTSVNITELQVNKTWEEMDFNERKALVEEFLAVDPTNYDGHCLYIADNLYQNATNAKALYGLQDDIPMCLDHRPYNEHIVNAVLLGNNESDIEHWGFINMEDDIGVFDKNITLLFKLNRTDYIWENGGWIIPDEKYRLINYSVGFHAFGEPGQKPTVDKILDYPTEYQDLYPT